MTDIPISVAARLDSYRGDWSEDSLYVQLRHDGWILAVADGVGGRAGGGDAARAAIDLVRAHAGGIGGKTDWSGFLVYVDSEVAAVADGGETTLVIAEIDGASIRGVSAGDSEAWFVTDDEIVKLTRYQQRKPFVGSGDAVPMSFSFEVPSGGGTLVVATDGLFHHVAADDICRLARQADVDTIAVGLVDAARGKSSGQLPDDIAVIVCRVLRRITE